MRIIGGEAKGRLVRLPARSPIRPTTDRVKEALFNILHIEEGASFLDLFAGSGNVGLEALSRGARLVTFVERDRPLAHALESRLAQFGFSARAEVIAADARVGLDQLVRRRARFQIIFSDPPYQCGLAGETLTWRSTEETLDEGGILVLQHSVREKPEGFEALSWVMVDQRLYGETALSFFRSH